MRERQRERERVGLLSLFMVSLDIGFHDDAALIEAGPVKGVSMVNSSRDGEPGYSYVGDT